MATKKNFTMTEIKDIAYNLCESGATLEQIENLRTYYLDARKKEQEEKRKAEAELQKSRAIRISTNYERGKTTLADLSDILYAALCNYAPELPQDIKVNMSCTGACKDLIEQIVAAYMDTKDGASTSPEDFDALITKLSKLL